MSSRWLVWIGAWAFLGTVGARAVVERVSVRTFAATASSTVMIDLNAGGITVTPLAESEGGSVRVRLRETFDSDDPAEIERRRNAVELTVAEENGAIVVRSRPRNAMRWSWQSWPPFALQVEVEVPANCRLALTTREGDIAVASLRGDVDARTGRGSVFINAIEGAVSVANEQGDIAVTACSGPLVASALSGGIQVGRTGGPARLFAKSGAIDVQEARGALSAKTDAGDLKVGFALAWTGGAELVASGGGVTVGLDARSAATVDARASRGGEVRVRDLKFETAAGGVGPRYSGMASEREGGEQEA